MQEFGLYNKEISSTIEQALNNNFLNVQEKRVDTAIFSNKYVSNRLRDLIHIDDLRKAGSFFTGDELSTMAVDNIENINSCSIILDPACGAGNLLLAASRKLRVLNTVSETLISWGEKLYGYDLHEEFIEATQLRLVIESVDRGALVDNRNLEKLKRYLSNIKVGNIYENPQTFKNASAVIMNPPYNSRISNKDCKWTSGKVNSSALFVELCLNNIEEGCQLSAILPDVLRSGSRYRKWRNIISSNLEFKINDYGRFDKKTDVDTFLLSGDCKKSEQKNIWFKSIRSAYTLKNLCKISVGPVVPFRDDESGTNSPYIYPKNVKIGDIVRTDEIKSRRKYWGRLINPPFVVVRRNSRPSDKYRASASIIIGNEPVAVENHLLVLEPKNNHVDECLSIIEILRNNNTNDFLNERIRCRHLTVSSLKDIPIKSRADLQRKKLR